MKSDPPTLVNKAIEYLDFCEKKSCGHCVPCRLGLPLLLKLLLRIRNNPGSEEDLKQLEYLSQMVIATSLCPHGRTSPIPLQGLRGLLKGGLNDPWEAEPLLDLVRCHSCSSPFATEPYLEFLKQNVDGPLNAPIDRAYCPECLRQARAVELIGELI